MDNLNFDWPLGLGMKSLVGGDHRFGSISQIVCFGDLSDEINRIPAICEYGDVVREKHETL